SAVRRGDHINPPRITMITSLTNRAPEERPVQPTAVRASYKDCQPASKGTEWSMSSGPESSPVFTTTHWSIVLKAGRRESRQADEALEKLCRAYWYPIYIFLRRSGWTAHDAEDLTQAFLERVLGKDYLPA